MYKALFFDVDDTLLNFELCSKMALNKTFHKFHLDFSDEIYKRFQMIDNVLWSKQKQGLLSVHDVLNQRFELLVQKLNLFQSGNDLNIEFQKQLSSTSVLEPNVIETIEYLSAKYRLFITSNGIKKMQLDRLKKAGILSYFEDLYVSDEIGYDKPDRDFFEICLKRCRLTCSEILLIGDSIEADITGAKKAGIDTCWYNPQKNTVSLPFTYCIHDLLQLKTIL